MLKFDILEGVDGMATLTQLTNLDSKTFSDSSGFESCASYRQSLADTRMSRLQSR
jgi:hypothetical protein